jgi:hypothetical protein
VQGSTPAGGYWGVPGSPISTYQFIAFLRITGMRSSRNVRNHGEAGRVIRASEIGEYSYCSRAWWYRHVLKVSPEGAGISGRLTAGRRAHARHGRLVAIAVALRALGVSLAVCGLLLLALMLALNLLR